MYSEQNEEEKSNFKSDTEYFFKKCYVFENYPDHGNTINSACNHVIIRIPICLLSVAFSLSFCPELCPQVSLQSLQIGQLSLISASH